MGSMASARSASICSVTAIVPSSAVLLAPTRPEIMSAVSSGPISRSVPKPAPQPKQPLRAVALHDGRRLDDHDRAGEERGDHHDGQRLDAHLVHAFRFSRVELESRERPRDARGEDAHLPRGPGDVEDAVARSGEGGSARRILRPDVMVIRAGPR